MHKHQTELVGTQRPEIKNKCLHLVKAYESWKAGFSWQQEPTYVTVTKISEMDMMPKSLISVSKSLHSLGHSYTFQARNGGREKLEREFNPESQT